MHLPVKIFGNSNDHFCKLWCLYHIRMAGNFLWNVFKSNDTTTKAISSKFPFTSYTKIEKCKTLRDSRDVKVKKYSNIIIANVIADNIDGGIKSLWEALEIYLNGSMIT